MSFTKRLDMEKDITGQYGKSNDIKALADAINSPDKTPQDCSSKYFKMELNFPYDVPGD